jgi:hypothetical protein
MKTKTILFYFAALLFISASCNSNEKLNEEENITLVNDQDMTTILEEQDDCFDEKMDMWFTRFNQYQEEGFTMEEANTKAIASVSLEFKDCPDKATDTRMAEQEVSMEE